MPAISHQDNRGHEAAPRHCTFAIETGGGIEHGKCPLDQNQLETEMTFRTRAKYSAIRKKYEGPLNALVVLAAVATLPIVVAQARGDGTSWVVAGDWLIWAVFVLD